MILMDKTEGLSLTNVRHLLRAKCISKDWVNAGLALDATGSSGSS